MNTKELTITEAIWNVTEERANEIQSHLSNSFYAYTERGEFAEGEPTMSELYDRYFRTYTQDVNELQVLAFFYGQLVVSAHKQ